MTQKVYSILLVDDEDLLREGVQELLEIQGYRVIPAADGHQALECLASSAVVDLIITDLVMPKMDGIDFVQRVREVNTSVPVIVVSGSTRNIMKRYGIENIQVPGANASLSKPFKGAELLAQVRELLEGNP